MMMNNNEGAEHCHEILTDANRTQYVCEAVKFTEHTHADPMPYMRLLRLDEAVTEPDAFGCVWLVNEEV